MARRYLSVNNRGHVRYGVVFNSRDSRAAWKVIAFLILTALLFSVSKWVNDPIRSMYFGIAFLATIIIGVYFWRRD
jgi:hypothetical protein